MADPYKTSLSFRRHPKDANVFEFMVINPTLKCQFLIPKAAVNQLRVDLERALTKTN